MSRYSKQKIDIPQEKAEILEEYKKRIECEKKAHKYVENLVERRENCEEDFIQALKWITKEHYEDVVEERFIIGICGYCLCRNELKEVSKAQFKIVKNKVYDITNRKKFCSQKCFLKSNYAMDQISTVPLWLRSPDKALEIKLKIDATKSDMLQGEEVPLRQVISTTEINLLENENPDNESLTGNTISCDSSNDKFTTGHPQKTIKNVNMEDEIEEILQTILGWFTVSTYQYLGFQSEVLDQDLISRESETTQPKEMMLEKKLYKPPLEPSPSTSAVKPVPNFPGHSIDSDLYQERVNEFYGGNLNILEKKNIEKDDHEKLLLPSVDSKNQMKIRQKIVQDHITKTIQNLRLPIGHQTNTILKDCHKLIASFKFCSKNVMFNTEKWRIIAIVLLLLISIPNLEIHELLKIRVVKSQFDMLLQLYGFDLSAFRVKLLSIIQPSDT